LFFNPLLIAALVVFGYLWLSNSGWFRGISGQIKGRHLVRVSRTNRYLELMTAEGPAEVLVPEAAYESCTGDFSREPFSNQLTCDGRSIRDTQPLTEFVVGIVAILTVFGGWLYELNAFLRRRSR
jgi:hypothetical protein